MKYRQASGAVSYGTLSTRTHDAGVQVSERTVTISGANEAMIYSRRLKGILDDMLAANPILQKIHQGEAVAETDLKTLTSTIPSVHLDALNGFY